MKIEFDPQGRNFLQVERQQEEIKIIISAVDGDNPRKRTINSVTLTLKEWEEIGKEINQ